MRAEQVMQKGVVAVSPELSLRSFEELLTSVDISGAPVTGPNGCLLGIASKTDIVRVLSQTGNGYEPYLDQLTVEDIMTREVVLAAPEEDARDVARRMIYGNLHRVLVANQGEILGIISTLDLLRLVCGGGGADEGSSGRS